MNRRGYVTKELVIGLAILAAIAAIVWGVKSYLDGVDERAYQRGKAEVQGQWNAANVQAAELERSRGAAVGKALLVADNAKVAADVKATNADQRWKEAVRESNRQGKPLAACDAPGSPEPARAYADGRAADQAPGTGLVAGERPRAGVPRFSPEFVRELDTAWTGLDGEPVFEAADRREGPTGPGAPWVTAEEVRDIHGENVRRCNTDRRELDSLITKIRAAAVAFDAASSGGSQ